MCGGGVIRQGGCGDGEKGRGGGCRRMVGGGLGVSVGVGIVWVGDGGMVGGGRVWVEWWCVGGKMEKRR